MKAKFSGRFVWLVFGVFFAGIWDPKVSRAAETYVPFIVGTTK